MTSMFSGIKLAASVGMPKPRLIIMPSLNSLATLRAIVCSSSRSFISGPFLPVISHRNAVDVYSGGNDYLRAEAAELHQLVHLDDGHFSRARHDGIKVAGSPLVDAVAVAVGFVSPHQGEIGFP